MRFIIITLLALIHAFLLVGNVRASHPLRTKPKISRQGEIPDGTGAFLVSHSGVEDGQDWCLTAKNGVRNGAQVGLELCDFEMVSTHY